MPRIFFKKLAVLDATTQLKIYCIHAVVDILFVYIFPGLFLDKYLQ